MNDCIKNGCRNIEFVKRCADCERIICSYGNTNELTNKMLKLEEEKKITDVDVYNWWIKNKHLYFSFQEFLIDTSTKVKYNLK